MVGSWGGFTPGTRVIPPDQAATIALKLYEAGIEGADIIAAYVDQQSQPKPWELLSDREWSNIAAKLPTMPRRW